MELLAGLCTASGTSPTLQPRQKVSFLALLCTELLFFFRWRTNRVLRLLLALTVLGLLLSSGVVLSAFASVRAGRGGSRGMRDGHY